MPRTPLGRNMLLALIVLFGVLGVGVLSGSGDWFPQRYAHDFYVAKGLVAVVAVVLILTHMSRAWPSVTTSGQRLRYLALLMITDVIAVGSTEQINQGVPVSGRNVGALLAAVFVIVAMAVSIRQDRRP